MQLKRCPNCLFVKSTLDFQKNISAKDGLQYQCKACRKEIDSRPEHRAQHRKRYHENKDQYNNSMYRRKYGINLEEYNQLLVQQNGGCAICHTACPTGRRLAVDHDHSTDKVRGLLCSPCNQGIGLFKDNTMLLERAIDYLARSM